VDAVSADTDPAAAGSPWPLLATALMSARNRPVLFVPCAKGGSPIADWQPGVDHQDRATLYGSMVYRGLQAANSGTLRAVLWWQGETDAQNSMAQATYNAYLDTLANAIAEDLGIPLLATRLQDLSGWGNVDESAVNAAINEAIADNSNVRAGPDLSDITPSADGVHLTTDAELLTAATRWASAIAAAMV
jgi:hypothetical protein